MASPCEILLDEGPRERALRLARIAAGEAFRIEKKFSRYRNDGIVPRINAGAGAPVAVDEETAGLIEFADRAWRLSDGRFDITSGVLRRAWTFDGSDRLPDPEEVERLRPFIGWDKARWSAPEIALPPGMEIDLGGIGKEYAVDRIFDLLRSSTENGFLVNLGGDIRAGGDRPGGAPWIVGIEEPGAEGAARRAVELYGGALATSGDARRYLLKDGKRYPHILDPRTGRPVEGAPRQITVLADTCIEAGLLATLAMLRGPEAESFLDAQGVTHWCAR